MRVEELSLTHYRNYEQSVVRFGSGFNLVVGDNGMGKTNLVDAIYYLCLTKSNFAWTDRHVIQEGSAFMRLEGRVVDGLTNTTSVIVAKVKRGEAKVFEYNGKAYNRLSEHIGVVPCVLEAPKDIHLILEGNEERRRFINQSIVQYDGTYLVHLQTYNRLLRQRNAYLKNLKDDRAIDKTYLQSITAQMEAPASYIYTVRSDFIKDIGPTFDRCYGRISSGREKCQLTYTSALAEKDLSELFDASFAKDVVLRRTNRGIHKDGLSFEINGAPIKHFASQGQQKSFIYALKLAQFYFLSLKTGKRPILILDDLFDKLDEKRVTHLLHILTEDAFGQVFITDTDPNRIADILRTIGTDFSLIRVDDGHIAERGYEEAK